ncbi:MAG: EAL domain-containing protein [Actinomycetota bacterium]|nr:EAL domain-containing protein [Actinomycetota bacterium]MDP9167913.1 EAL domain-containing protein [Actinomycetota bacterium]
MSDGLGTAEPSDVAVAMVLDGLQVSLQPVVDLASGAVFAYEALARFPSQAGRPVEDVIAWAHVAGHGPAVEAACLRAALNRRGDLPDAVRLSVNLSPDMVDHPDVASTWDDDLDGVLVEITEYRASRLTSLHDELARLRQRGAAIAVDDAGTGHANLFRLTTIRPDYVKVDRTIVTNVRASMAQQATLAELVEFSRRLRADVIAEGLETLEDLTAMADFDVDYGQGWIVGAPADGAEPVSDVVIATCQQSRRHLVPRGDSATE